jgi:adenosylcobyric acid synthase
MRKGNCIGTYIHGFLDNAPVIEHLLAGYTAVKSDATKDPQAFKDEQYNKLAEHIRQHVDIERIYKILTDD